MDITILFEDDHIVVIDKPSGVICNRAETVKVETIQDWMEGRCSEQWQAMVGRGKQVTEDEAYFVQRGGLVHRLDKETAGVMILAKTVEAFVELLRQFKEREVRKTYLALTHGLWKAPRGEINLPIGRRRDDRKKMGVVEDGRESVTEYSVIKEIEGKYSLIEFKPKTGRMHQIRVHARHVGHPLVGDLQYAGRKRSREDRTWCQHIMLLAQTLELTHPVTKERMKWQSKNEDMNYVISMASPKEKNL